MRRCHYQTKVNSASRLCSARDKRGGEGTNQQRGPEAGPTDDWLDSDHEEQHHAGLTPHVYLSCQVPLREAILGAGTKEFPLATQKNTLQLFVKVFQLGKGYAVHAPAAVSLKYGKNFWVTPVNSLPGRAITREWNPWEVIELYRPMYAATMSVQPTPKPAASCSFSWLK